MLFLRTNFNNFNFIINSQMFIIMSAYRPAI